MESTSRSAITMLPLACAPLFGCGPFGCESDSAPLFDCVRQVPHGLLRNDAPFSAGKGCLGFVDSREYFELPSLTLLP